MHDFRRDEFRIQDPPPDRHPLKVSAYQFTRSVNSQLTPLFPYTSPGSIVPCVGFLRGDSESYGYFLHMNSVDEVVLCLGSSGGRMRPGQVAVGARTHGVAGPSDADANSFMLLVITQRQAVGERQYESIVFVCEKCQAELFRHDFDARGDPADACRPLETLAGSEFAAAQFNADESKRTCGKCGHVSPPFPNHKWGWGRYLSNTWITEHARQSLEGAARSG